MAEAVAAEAFADVAALARAAESLGAIASDLQAGGALVGSADDRMAMSRANDGTRQAARGIILRAEPATVLAIAKSEPTASERSTAAANQERYPQYFREADRIVKRAWSTKERQPYEHKAPREIVDVLLAAIQRRKGHVRPFDAADVMPLMKDNGDEYPSYQSYLGLGWLRHAGAIAKGRDGYLLRPGWSRERVAQAWDTLPSMA
jgi:hypothetical protein